MNPKPHFHGVLSINALNQTRKCLARGRWENVARGLQRKESPVVVTGQFAGGMDDAVSV